MTRDRMVQILDLARWAPSGDNTQPWFFEIIDECRVAIHGFDTRDHVIYDFDGRPSQMAHGALLETMRIAATRFGLAMKWSLRSGSSDNAPVYDAVFTQDSAVVIDPLFESIQERMVQRRPMKMESLKDEQRQCLSSAVGPDYSIVYFGGWRERLRVARLLWNSAHVRLVCPEAYSVHRDIIEWGVNYSEDRLPEAAIGVDVLTAKLMKWVMRSWRRVEFFNRYLFGTIAPRVQLDLIPGFACASHLLLCPKKRPEVIQDYVEAGMAMQRLWLTVTSMDLFLQPEMTPLIFRWYAQAGRGISGSQKVNAELRAVSIQFAELLGIPADQPCVFFARVGYSNVPKARSLRKPLERLWKSAR